MSLNQTEKVGEVKTNAIPLAEASKRSGYTPEHLNFLARKGTLKAQKIGRNWYTTEEWFSEFMDDLSMRKSKSDDVAKRKTVSAPPGPPGKDKSSGDVRVFETEEKTISERENEKESGSISISTISVSEVKEENKKTTEKDIQKNDDFIFIGSSIPRNGRSFLFQILTGMFSMAIALPMVFLAVYSTKYYLTSEKLQKEKIAMYEKSPAGEIMNENDIDVDSETTQAVRGIVSGVEDDSAKRAGIILASENFKASSVSLGGEIILTSSNENLPLEISDIKSESFVASKATGSSSDSTENVKLVISWRTSKPAISEIGYSKNNGQDLKTMNEDSFGYYHTVILDDIQPRTSYVYQIKTRDRWGNKNDSDLFGVFTTSKPVSVFDLISKQINEIFGWAVKK